jgi:3'-phosphoadenosine 5'-phosphosulfate sulfotransferase (PAPS reductase)/FAD synthetase
MRVFAFGGGVQSVAVLVLQSQGKLSLPYDAYYFADLGEAENPDTLRYVREVAAPFAERHGIRLEVVRRKGDTLLEVLKSDRSDIPIPVYFASGGMGRRNCTDKWKVFAVDRAIRAAGHREVVIGYGISIDEWHRVRDPGPYRQNGLIKRREYPLFELGFDREDCKQIIAKTGLPIPPKSACWFCPFHSRADWRNLRNTRPDLFEAAIALEDRLAEKRAQRGLDKVFLRKGGLRPLLVEQSLGLESLVLENDDVTCEVTCESGYCWI